MIISPIGTEGPSSGYSGCAGVSPMKKTAPDQSVRNPTQYNIEAIAKLEDEALNRRTATERRSDAIVRFVGSMTFLLLHVILVAVWSIVNLNWIPGVKAFDPFPFGIFGLVGFFGERFPHHFRADQSKPNGSSSGTALSPRSSGRHACRARTDHDAPDVAKAVSTYGSRRESYHGTSSRI
jgi:hypothetical protein